MDFQYKRKWCMAGNEILMTGKVFFLIYFCMIRIELWLSTFSEHLMHLYKTSYTVSWLQHGYALSPSDVLYLEPDLKDEKILVVLPQPGIELGFGSAWSQDLRRASTIFSSPEPKAHRWAYSIGRHPSSVNIFKRHLLWSHEADSYQISHIPSLGLGNK